MSELVSKRTSNGLGGSAGQHGRVADGAAACWAEVPEALDSGGQCFGLVPLGSVALAIKDGTHGTHVRVREGVPFLSAKNITAAGTICWGKDDDRITESEYALIHQTFRLENCDLLLTIVGSLGRRAIYRGERVTFQRSVAYVRPDTKKCSERFLFHWFAHPHFQQELVRRSNATAQAGLYLGELARVSIPECAGQVQTQVARVLDTIDTAIRQTEAIIAKLKQVKLGLLHDLLTRGIDANGEMRAPQSQAPNLYKLSPLGWIPREWSASSIGDSCANVVDCPHSTPVFRDHGVLVARTMHIKGGTFLEHVASYVSEAAYQERIARLCPEPGDVVFTREAPVGEAFVIPVGMRICLGQRVMLLRPRPDKMHGEFLVAQIYSGAVADRIATLTSGTTNPHLNVAEVRRFLVPLPSMEEQCAIGRHLSRLESEIDAESLKTDKLCATKSGLMDDLLTGRIRVTPLLEAASTP